MPHLVVDAYRAIERTKADAAARATRATADETAAIERKAA